MSVSKELGTKRHLEETEKSAEINGADSTTAATAAAAAITKKLKTGVQYRPSKYHDVNIYLTIKNCSEAVGWYVKAFNGKELYRLTNPKDNSVMHAEVQLGDSILMMSEENAEWGVFAPETCGGTASGTCLYVKDVDQIFKQAIDAGATVEKEVVDQFYGDRTGSLRDPYGHRWTIATHVEDVSPEEMQRRMAAQKAKADGDASSAAAASASSSPAVEKPKDDTTKPEVNFQSAGYTTAVPYICVAKCGEAIKFYENVFGAKTKECYPDPANPEIIHHAELKFGDSIVMMGSESEDYKSPSTLKSVPASLVLYVENADEVFNKAVEAGAKSIRPPSDHFYGDRMGALIDPFGHKWSIATHIEDVSPEEMSVRSAKLFEGDKSNAANGPDTQGAPQA